MNKVIWIIPVILLITAGCIGNMPVEGTGSPGGRGYYDRGGQGYYPGEYDNSYVYNYLAPYGDWIEMSPYGYVWTPRHMGYRWRPYTDGRWAWTDYGWTWISDLLWGDIPFHYGRWGLDDDIGWYWVPGNVWGPAWVSWRSNDLYIGWAPLPPGWEFSDNMDYNSRFLDIPGHFWIFVESPNFRHHRLSRYVLPFERNRTIIDYTSFHNKIRIRDKRAINEGIDADEVRRVTRREVAKYQIKDSQQPGQSKIVGREIRVFRPEIRQAEAAKPKGYLNREEARQKLATVKIWEPREKRPVDKEKSVIRQRQNDEKKLLERSQAKEINDMQRKRADEEKRIRDASEKEKIRKNYENQVSELKKRHETERREIQSRHSKDSTHIRSQYIEKKENKKG